MCVNYNVDYDESWYKIVKNVDIVVGVVETSHVIWKYISLTEKKKMLEEFLYSQVMSCSQIKKAILVVDSLTASSTIDEALHQLSMYLEEKLQQREQLGYDDISCCWVQCVICPLMSEEIGSLPPLPPVHYHNYSSVGILKHLL